MSLKEQARIKFLEIRVYELEYRNRIIFKVLEKIVKVLLEAGLVKTLEVLQT